MSIACRTLDFLIIKELTVLAGKIADDARKNSSWSSVIPGAIYVGETVKDDEGKYSVSVILDISEDTGVPYAAAFEYGSGIHGEGGGYYIIKPKEAKALAFDWLFEREVFEGYPGPNTTKEIPEDERVFMSSVIHPGVHAVPFMQPAFDDNISEVGNVLADVFARGIGEVVMEIAEE